MDGMAEPGEGDAEDAQMEEEEKDDVVIDPDDPVYGLEQRLKHTNLDEKTKQVIRNKLLAA